MKTIIKIAIAALFGFAMMTTTLSADAAKGQKLYSKYMKDVCGFSGAKFAASHTQDEWEEINTAGKFGDEVKAICPGISDSYKDAWSGYLYDFSYEYASDSGNVPSC